MLISDNGTTRVEKIGSFIIKTQPELMCDTEMKFLNLLKYSGYVPHAQRLTKTKIRIDYIKPQKITKPDQLRFNFEKMLRTFKAYGVRHGDLTEKNIVIGLNNTVFAIDWSESKTVNDPLPDKRPEGDKYWLGLTFNRLTGEDFEREHKI